MKDGRERVVEDRDNKTSVGVGWGHWQMVLDKFGVESGKSGRVAGEWRGDGGRELGARVAEGKEDGLVRRVGWGWGEQGGGRRWEFAIVLKCKDLRSGAQRTHLRHWGVTLAGTRHGGATGSERWDWFVGARHWGVTLAGTRHGGSTGSERWDWFVGARHGGATLAGCEWWDWFMGVFHGGTQLDQGDGIDLWRRTMGAHDIGYIWVRGLIYVGVSWGRAILAGLGLWDWFMGACRMAKYYMVAECKWQSTIWMLNVNDDTTCLMSGVKVSVQGVFG